MKLLALWLITLQAKPVVQVTQDDTTITHSCRVEIAPGLVIADYNNNGVIHIRASDVQVEFADGALLRGAPPDQSPSQHAGVGIRIDGQKNVTLRNAQLSGFRCGVWASDADGLTLEKVDARGMRRDRLGSTPVAEDPADWLWPHSNDQREWVNKYGAAVYVERSKNVTVRACRARQAQNGLILDRVSESRVFDNDFSFLSGWGVAMWRSSRNLLSRNAVDFCVRGYSHGVYNRGQDSAGFLVFEQCSENVFAENSGTHSGDGFFGFAGSEALGEQGRNEPGWYSRRGNNDNLLIGNDFSYAPAHGIEMTFSFGNRYCDNRLVENAICGVWGGYSQDTLINGNEFTRNGEGSYGLERGGVNIEHGRGNRIVNNRFTENRCGVHLWWDPDAEFQEKPWGKANDSASTGNLIAGNSFEGDELAYQFRGPSDVTLGPNRLAAVQRELDRSDDARVERVADAPIEPPINADYSVRGETRPVGARVALRGRHQIIMGEWGPWDHESPLLRFARPEGMSHVYELFGWPAETAASVRGNDLHGALDAAGASPARSFVVSAPAPGVYAYSIEVRSGGVVANAQGALIAAEWNCAFAAWDERSDPREKIDVWRNLMQGITSTHVRLASLSFKFGGRGPSDLKLADALTAAKLGRDRFGLVAETALPLTAGAWEISTVSDDGVRVWVNDQVVLENWSWHGPTRDTGAFTLPEAGVARIKVEYFEIDGHAVLDFSIQPARNE